MFTVHQVHFSTPFNYFEREILIVVPVCDVRDGRSDYSDHMKRCAFKMVRHVVAFRECPRSRFILTYLV
jgi:hypothetical protein